MKVSLANKFTNETITVLQKCLTILPFPVTLNLVLDQFAKLCCCCVSPPWSLISLEGGSGNPSKGALPGLEGDEEPKETGKNVPLPRKSCLLWPEACQLHWPESIKNSRWSVLTAWADNWSCLHGHVNSLPLKVGWLFQLLWLICCLFSSSSFVGFATTMTATSTFTYMFLHVIYLSTQTSTQPSICWKYLSSCIDWSLECWWFWSWVDRYLKLMLVILPSCPNNFLFRNPGHYFFLQTSCVN